MRLTPDGRLAISASTWTEDIYVSSGRDVMLKEWDLASGQCLRTLKVHHAVKGDTYRARFVALSPDGRWAVSGFPGSRASGRVT